MAKIKIYTTPSCVYCQMAKDYFKDKNAAYEEINVAEKPEEGQKMLEKTGQLGVPQIFIEKDGKEEIVIGFDQSRLEQLLG